MNSNDVKNGQVVRLTKPIIPDEGHWFFEKGSSGRVIGRDAHLVRVCMDDHRVTICVNPHNIELVSIALENAE